MPLLLDGADEATEIGRGGVVLGAFDVGGWPESSILLAAGQTLLFYTDGATDARGRSDRFGEQRLRSAAAGDGDPGALVDRIQRAL